MENHRKGKGSLVTIVGGWERGSKDRVFLERQPRRKIEIAPLTRLELGGKLNYRRIGGNGVLNQSRVCVVQSVLVLTEEEPLVVVRHFSSGDSRRKEGGL